MTHLDILQYYLVMKVYQYKDYTYLSQSKYILDILQKFRMECKPTAILVPPEITLSPTSNFQLAYVMTYRQLIGNLLYLIISRPNIFFVVNLMERFMQKLYVEYLNVVKQILRYVVRTKDLALKYCKLPSFFLSRFLDSNYGEDRDDKK